MEYTIYNDSFLQSVFSWKRRKSLAWLQYDFEDLCFEDKVRLVVERLATMRFKEARMILTYWEETSEIIALLEKYNIKSYKIMREYEKGILSGIIDIYFTISFESSFLETLITKHYGYELGKDDILNVFPCLAIDNGKQIIAMMLYDDRGLYEYVWQKKNRNY